MLTNSKRAPRIPTSGGPAVVPGAGGILGELIAKHESGSEGYGAFNRGTAGNGGKLDFSKMTLAQIMTLQRLKNSRRLFAVGKYQIIPLTIRDAFSKMKLKDGDFYNPSMQENLFRNYLIAIKRPAIKAFITGGGSSLHMAQMALAFEFASVARPDTGRSNYDGVGVNKASISADEIKAALQSEVNLYDQLIAGKNNRDDAWDALSPGFV